MGGTITWVYDTVSGGHHPRVQETTTPGTVIVEYDVIGRRLKLSATGQTDTTYTYDNNSRLKMVTQGSQSVTLAYEDAGRRASLTYPNGVITSYGYDNANRLLTINHAKTPTTIEALTYQNDAAGNRVTLNRMNAAASLLPTASSSSSYDAANEQTQINGVMQTFDAKGNLINDGTNTYTWDSRNRLTGITGGSTASFVYDGLGRRKSRTIGGTTIGFWYDGADVLAELSGSTPTALYLRGLSVDEPFVRKQTGGSEFYQTDALGTTLELTDGTGAVATTYTQEPYGKTTQTGSSTNRFQFTGRENDGTGLFYYRARYYSPKLQRFLGEDPIEFSSGDLNIYAYVKNRPTAFTDPTGELIPPLMIAGATFGAAFNVGAAVVAAYVLDQPLAWSDYANAAFSGAVSGALGGVAGPLAGSTARLLGMSSTSAFAKAYTGLTGASSTALGQFAANLMTGRKPSKGLLSAAIFGGAGGFIGSFVPNNVANTLQQAHYFGPTLSNLLLFANPSGLAISASNALGNLVSGGSAFVQ